jgi:hypothetical protein
MKRFYVIDEDHLTSFSAKADASETFGTRTAAQKRAVHLANTEPGKQFFICEAVAVAQSEVMTASVRSF